MRGEQRQTGEIPLNPKMPFKEFLSFNNKPQKEPEGSRQFSTPDLVFDDGKQLDHEKTERTIARIIKASPEDTEVKVRFNAETGKAEVTISPPEKKDQ